MQPNLRNRFGHRSPRAAFTLIELLVAIVIASLLMALLIPVISGARNSARQAQVRTDISSLGNALEDFKANHGMYPPSRIVLYERATGDPSWAEDTTGTGPTGDLDLQRSRALILRMWPQFDFTRDRDIDGDGTFDGADVDGDATPDGEPFVLTASECLVFFLGGMRPSEDTNENQTLDAGEDQNGNGQLDALDGTLGFSANPANPFGRGGSNRVGPYHEFQINRLIDVQDGFEDGMLEYVDPIPNQLQPYVYFSSYDGTGYPSDTTTPASATITWSNVDGQPLIPLAYYQTVDNDNPAASTPWNAKTFQIISPGFDAGYGVGGAYDPEEATDNLTGDREAERDNITNFSSGPLAN